MSPDESIMYLNLDQDEQTSLFSELELPSRSFQFKPQRNDLLSDSSSTDFNTSGSIEKEFGIQPSILTEAQPEEDSFTPIKYENKIEKIGPNNSSSSKKVEKIEITDKTVLEKKTTRNKEGKEVRKKLTLERNRVAAKNSRLKKKLWHSNLNINLHLLKIKNEEQHQLNSNLIKNLKKAKEELTKLGPEATKRVEEFTIPKPSTVPKLPTSIDWKELDKMVDSMDFDQLTADAIATNTDPSQFCFTPIDPNNTNSSSTNIEHSDFNIAGNVNLDFSDK